MESFIIGLSMGLLLGIGVLVLFLLKNAPKRFFRTWKSSYNFQDTLKRIEEAVKQANWSIPNKYDLQKTMINNDFQVRPVYVFSVCKPEHAYQLLSRDKQRQVAAMMPCRLAVYEKSDGATYITMMNSAAMSKLMGGIAKKVMAEASVENLEIIKNALSEKKPV